MKKTAFAVLTVTILMLAILTACGKTPETTQAATASEPAAATSPVPATDNTAAAAETSVPFGKSGTVAAASKTETKTLTIPSGTPVTVRLQTSVSSASANSGDSFAAVLDAPLVLNGKTIAPAGADVAGRVVAAKKSGRLKDPGMLQLAISSITIDGRAVPVSSSSVIARGASHKKRNWAMIGGGAGGGALVGGLVGGGKGALIGSAVGAGAGTTAAYATGEKDVAFAAERRLTFRLREPIVIR